MSNILDAFIPEFAKAMHQDLLMMTFTLHEAYTGNGFHYKHRNYSDLMNQTNAMFDHQDTKKFIQSLSGRVCMGHSIGSASCYEPGDHSLPHTDHGGARTATYVWHLSKNWQPEWGGALYWCCEQRFAFNHASFNTLVLFSVTVQSSHFVTTVSSHATEKRLAFNGWWHSAWQPSVNDNSEEMLATPEQRFLINHAQAKNLEAVVRSGELDPKRREKIMSLYEDILKNILPNKPARTLVVQGICPL